MNDGISIFYKVLSILSLEILSLEYFVCIFSRDLVEFQDDMKTELSVMEMFSIHQRQGDPIKIMLSNMTIGRGRELSMNNTME